MSDFLLSELGERKVAAVAAEEGDDVGVRIEARAFGGDVVGNDEVGVLGSGRISGCGYCVGTPVTCGSSVVESIRNISGVNVRVRS